jgi:hypothetical protein
MSARTFLLVVPLTFLAGTPTTAEAPPPLPAERQAQVRKAIAQGVKFLRRAQDTSGSWSDEQKPYAVGYAALPALALLECGVPAQDRAIKRAALLVRRAAPELQTTYEISLAILFLDRLREARDRELIRTLALRLVAAQTPSGGWGYPCASFDAGTRRQLLTVLRQIHTRPAPPAGGKQGERPRPPRIPEALQALTVFADPDQLPKPDLPGQLSDGSNTQFATMALWTARRYDVPLERTLQLVSRRYQTSQGRDGRWEYRYFLPFVERPAMTTVGLLGLAVGHGLTQPQGKAPPRDDPRVLAGFAALLRYLDQPQAVNQERFPVANPYFLWSVERVAVLYDLSTIGGKDWYRQGAEILLPGQRPDGHWEMGGYVGASAVSDTCFALLFLQRANLIKDLTARLPFKPAQLSSSIARHARDFPAPAASSSRSPGELPSEEKKR